jgi:hypothetical protein
MTAADTPAEIRWRELGRPVRKPVARAVRQGRAVDVPRDAALAAAYAEAALDWLSRQGACARSTCCSGCWPSSRSSSPGPGRSSRCSTPHWVVSLAMILAAFVGVVATATVASVVHLRHRAAAANRICAREEARLRRLGPQRLESRESRRRMIEIEREVLVSLGNLAPEGQRTSLQSQLIAWRRYEVELDAWLFAATGDPRVPAERLERAKARKRSRDLARRVGASNCARV